MVGHAGLPRQPVGERADAEAGPGVGGPRLGDQVDELGVQGVELPDDDGEAVLDVDGGPADMPIVRRSIEMQHLFDQAHGGDGDPLAHRHAAARARAVRAGGRGDVAVVAADGDGDVAQVGRRGRASGRRRRCARRGVVDLDPGVAGALAEQVPRDVAGRQPASAAHRDHHVGHVLAHAAPQRPGLGGRRAHAGRAELVRHRRPHGSPIATWRGRVVAGGRGAPRRRRARAPSIAVRSVGARVVGPPRAVVSASRLRCSTARTPNEKRSRHLGRAHVDDGVAEAVVAVAHGGPVRARRRGCGG